MIPLILYQIGFAVFIWLLAKHDALSIQLRKTNATQQDIKRIGAWHQVGSAIYAAFVILACIGAESWVLGVSAALLRVALFDLFLSYEHGEHIAQFGTTAYWDKVFAKIFGKKGVARKSMAFFAFVVILNVVYFKYFS